MTKEKQVLVEGILINYFENGEGDKTIVFLAGNSMPANLWSKQLNDPFLSGKFRMIAIDWPGVGKSSRISNYSINKTMAVPVPKVIEALGIREFILAGFSYGTIVLGECAPLLTGCKGFAIIASNLTSDKKHPGTWIIPFPEMIALTAETVDEQTLDGLAAMLIRDDVDLRREYKQGYLATDPAFRTAIADMVRDQSWGDQIGNIERMKVLAWVVFGEQERVVRTSYLDDFAPRWKNKTFMIPNAGHFVFAEQPQVFNNLLSEFATELLK